MPNNLIRRVYFLIPICPEISGVATSLTTLAIELARRGIDVWVFVGRPVDKNNQYRRRLQRHNIKVVSPPTQLRFLDEIDWDMRDRVLASIVRVMRPMFLPFIVLDALRRQRSMSRSWQGAFGYLMNVLGRYQLPDFLDRFFNAQLNYYSRKYRPDIVEVSYASFLHAVAWGYAKKIPTIYKHCETAKSWTPAQDQFLNMASCVIAKSETSKLALLPMIQYREPILVIPNAFDHQLLLNEYEEQDDIGVVKQKDVVRLVYIGRLNPEKGVQFLPETFQHVIEQIKDIELLIVGSGYLESELRSECHKLGVSERVHFLGTVTHEKAFHILRQSDILVFPSLSEGLPNVVIEAMSCGKPIVATDIPGTKDLITDGINGFLVPPADPKRMASTIIKVVTDKNLRRQLGEKAFETFNNGAWSPEILGDRTLAAYQYAQQTFRIRGLSKAEFKNRPSLPNSKSAVLGPETQELDLL